jgi:cell division protease FtsH
MVMTDDEKELTAYHEAGHALVGLLVKGNDPLHKVTIIPRGRALGVTMNLPETDKYGFKKSELCAKLAMTFGGRVAETLIYGAEDVTTGAGQDIQQATNYARRMVTEWGMSKKLGPLAYSGNEQEVFLGHSVTQTKNLSDATAKIIDEEIRRFAEEAEALATKVLTENLDALHAVATALLEYETLTGDEVKQLLEGGSIERPDEFEPPEDSTAATSVPPSTKAKKPEGPGGMEPEPTWFLTTWIDGQSGPEPGTQPYSWDHCALALDHGYRKCYAR